MPCRAEPSGVESSRVEPSRAELSGYTTLLERSSPRSTVVTIRIQQRQQQHLPARPAAGGGFTRGGRHLSENGLVCFFPSVRPPGAKVTAHRNKTPAEFIYCLPERSRSTVVCSKIAKTSLIYFKYAELRRNRTAASPASFVLIS